MIDNNNFIFIPDLDSTRNDIKFEKYQNLKLLLEEAEKIPDCLAVNSLGFFKSKINPFLKRTGYLNSGDGLYIKKSYYDSEVLGYNEVLLNQDNFKLVSSNLGRGKKYCFIHSCQMPGNFFK